MSNHNAWESGFIDVAGGQMCFHRTGGEYPPLVLAHGGTDNGLCWSRVAVALQDWFDIIMLDARSHGNSSRVPQGEEDRSAEDVASVIAALRLDQPAVMGHSLGARTMSVLANDFPGLVSRVILEEPPLAEFQPPDSFIDWLKEIQSLSEAEIITLGKSTSPTWHDDEFPAWAGSKKQVDPKFIARLRFVDWEETIHRIASPTLLIYGDSDRGGIVTHEAAKRAASINSNIVIAHIAGAGHNVRREKFEQYVAVVKEFLIPQPEKN
jgi:N-formylmaleamate deformylase